MNVFDVLREKVSDISELIRPVGWSRKIEVVETKAVIEIVNQVEHEYNNGWIPCSERLPREFGKYLVSTDGTFGIDVIDIARFENNKWHKACNIIAWQPLPEPYKGV